MAIIHSCCCWRSLRTGSYAAAIYTMVLFSIIIITMAHFIHEEWRYLNGELDKPGAKSYLETDTISHTTVVFNIIVLGCSSLGFLASILLIIGIYTDKKYLLLPWIITMLSETAIEVIHTGYLFILETMNFNPITAILFTLDFFLIIVNVYSIICVISQYQEYLAGRGTAIFDYDDRLAHVQYTAGPHTTTTATSQAGRSRRVSNAPSARAEPEDSVVEKAVRASVLVKTHKAVVKKHVQFPDEKTCADEESSDAPEGVEAPSVVPSLWMEREPAPPEPAPPER